MLPVEDRKFFRETSSTPRAEDDYVLPSRYDFIEVGPLVIS